MTKVVEKPIARGGGGDLHRRAFLTLLAGGLAGISPLRAQAAAEDRQVTLYKEPGCSCCEGYADHLRANGFAVTIVPTHDLPLMSEKYGIPVDLEPCHISLVAGYVVGGHVPVEVVKRLLAERPKITGITLAGMPPGSPGMPGTKTAPFKIYEIADGPRKLYAAV